MLKTTGGSCPGEQGLRFFCQCSNYSNPPAVCALVSRFFPRWVMGVGLYDKTSWLGRLADFEVRANRLYTGRCGAEHACARPPNRSRYRLLERRSETQFRAVGRQPGLRARCRACCPIGLTVASSRAPTLSQSMLPSFPPKCGL